MVNDTRSWPWDQGNWFTLFLFSMVNKVMKAKMVEVYVCVCITIVFVDDALQHSIAYLNWITKWLSRRSKVGAGLIVPHHRPNCANRCIFFALYLLIKWVRSQSINININRLPSISLLLSILSSLCFFSLYQFISIMASLIL